MGMLLAQEWPGLPVGGPVIRDDLKDQLGLEDDDDDRFLDRIVLAVNRKVRRWPIARYAANLPEWPEDIVEGSMMLAARLYRRRNSPSGVESFGAEGAVYVQRHDPDIAMLLELGTHAGPQVG